MIKSGTMSHSILCIEDSSTFALFLKSHLQKRGYDVRIAIDGESGIQSALEVAPDLILLDVILPGIDGYQVCKQLRAEPRLKETPILMLTGQEEMGSVWSGLAVGANDYLLKTNPKPKILLLMDEKLDQFLN